MNHHKRLPACLYFIPFCLTIFLLLTFSGTSAKPERNIIINSIDTLPVEEDPESRIYDEVEVEASFQGGEEGWRSYLMKNLNANTPVENGAPAGRYTVMVQFIVAKNGAVSAVKALTKNGYGMEAEVIRILRQSPPWVPAVQNGRKVKAYRKQPVTFEISEEKKKKKRG
jgi:protein TonB